jgi:hypothetical protein
MSKLSELLKEARESLTICTRIDTVPLDEDFKFDKVSDRDEAYKHMDEHFNFWAHNMHGSTNGTPCDTAEVEDRLHSALSDGGQRLCLESKSPTRDPDTAGSPTKLSDLQDENNDPRLTHNHRGLRQFRDDSDNSARHVQRDYDTDHFQTDYNAHQIQKEHKPRLVDRFDKPEPRDKQPRRRIPIIGKIETANSSSVLATKSANEKRSARQKMKRRGRWTKQGTTSPSVPSENESDRRPEDNDGAPVRKPTILRLTGSGEEKRKQVTTALLENRIDLNREADLLALMKVFTAERNKDSVGDGEQSSEHAHEVSLPQKNIGRC